MPKKKKISTPSKSSTKKATTKAKQPVAKSKTKKPKTGSIKKAVRAPKVDESGANHEGAVACQLFDDLFPLPGHEVFQSHAEEAVILLNDDADQLVRFFSPRFWRVDAFGFVLYDFAPPCGIYFHIGKIPSGQVFWYLINSFGRRAAAVYPEEKAQACFEHFFRVVTSFREFCNPDPRSPSFFNINPSEDELLEKLNAHADNHAESDQFFR